MSQITLKVQSLIDRFNTLKNSHEFWEGGDEYWGGPGYRVTEHDNLKKIEDDATGELADFSSLEPQTQKSKDNRDALKRFLEDMERFERGCGEGAIRRFTSGRELVEVGGMPVGILARIMRKSSHPNNLEAWRPGTGKKVIALEQCEWKRIGFSEGRRVTEKDIDRMVAMHEQDPDFQKLTKRDQDRKLIDALHELVDKIENKGIHEAEEREKRIDDFCKANGLSRGDSPGAFLKWLTAEKKPDVPFGCDAFSFAVPDTEPAYSEWYEEVMGLIFDLDAVLHYSSDEHHPEGKIRHIPCMHKEEAWTAFGMDGRRCEAAKGEEMASEVAQPEHGNESLNQTPDQKWVSYRPVVPVDISKYGGTPEMMMIALREDYEDDAVVAFVLRAIAPGGGEDGKISQTELGLLMSDDRHTVDLHPSTYKKRAVKNIERAKKYDIRLE